MAEQTKRIFVARASGFDDERILYQHWLVNNIRLADRGAVARALFGKTMKEADVVARVKEADGVVMYFDRENDMLAQQAVAAHRAGKPTLALLGYGPRPDEVFGRFIPEGETMKSKGQYGASRLHGVVRHCIGEVENDEPRPTLDTYSGVERIPKLIPWLEQVGLLVVQRAEVTS